MKSDKGQSNEASELRRKAESRLQAKLVSTQLPRNEAEAQRLLHELQIHQIELEMQNAELRQARDEEEKSLEMYTDLYDFAPVGYVTLDHEGIIRAANLTVAKLLGIERSRMVGRYFRSFVVTGSRSTFLAFIDKVFASQRKETCELALLSEDKTQLFVQIEASMAASEGECRAAIVDISVRRQLEDKLGILHTELINRAAELEAANIDLEAFNYSVSHDLRGPLAVIAGYCGVVEELYGSKLDEQCRGHIRTIQEATMNMNQLIDTLLDFSRVKRVEIHLENVDLTQVAEEVALVMKGSDPARPVTFRIAKGIMVDGDARLLRVVLNNLMGNAWKYSGKQIAAVIELGVTEVKGKPAYFIRDNGPGFDMEHAEKLFIPFQRLPGTDVVGHGVGLATVDRIVRRHGGKVWAESKPGAGATFYFTLA